MIVVLAFPYPSASYLSEWDVREAEVASTQVPLAIVHALFLVQEIAIRATAATIRVTTTTVSTIRSTARRMHIVTTITIVTTMETVRAVEEGLWKFRLAKMI